MLINFVSPTFVILKALTTSNMYFYLTGTRFFGNYTKDSDYDFLVDEKDVDIGYLRNLGFCTSDQYGHGVNTLLWQGRVHIIVVSDIKTRLIVQEKLKRSGLMVILKKPERKKLWSLVLEEFDVRVA